MKNLFKVRQTHRAQKEQYKLYLEIPKSNQVSFGTKSLRIQGPRVLVLKVCAYKVLGVWY